MGARGRRGRGTAPLDWSPRLPPPITVWGPQLFLRRFLCSSLRSATNPSASSFSTTRARERRAVRFFMMFPRMSVGRGQWGGEVWQGVGPPPHIPPLGTHSPSEPLNSSKSRSSSSSCSSVHSTMLVPFLCVCGGGGEGCEGHNPGCPPGYTECSPSRGSPLGGLIPTLAVGSPWRCSPAPCAPTAAPLVAVCGPAAPPGWRQ